MKVETVDDLRRALGVESLREMSGEKVLALAKMWQGGELSEAVQLALLQLVPETFRDMTKAMDGSLTEAVNSNDASSSSYYAAVSETKQILKARLENPSSSEQYKMILLEQIERLDDKLSEHDLNNKRFGLEALHLKKEMLLKVGVGALALGAASTPSGRKLLIDGAKNLALRK